ncbi:endolytic transglycosylase MltG [Janibacter sp. G56]|uniref:endolytic transglycosylase MltG n=1 Tax=Janibacter sp. G56 TaxID=3418717 RepID=UPI003D071438
MTEPHLRDSIFAERPAPPTRAARRQSVPPSKKGRSRVALILGAGVVVAALVLAYGVLSPLFGSFLESKDYEGPGSGQVQVIVNEGDSGSAIGSALQEAGVVKTTSAFVSAAGADPKKAAAIQPGAYTLKREMKATDALALLASGENRQVPRVTIREGLWATEIYDLLSKETGVPVKDYEKAATSSELELPASAEGEVEGYLFPKSYEFPVKSTAVEQLNIMIRQTLAEFETLGVAEADQRRVLTVASIVEGESGQADRAKVASVIENRLKDTSGGTGGRLEMDSTIHYLTKQRGAAGTSDEDRATQSPYNTYLNAGLPPGPINNPGAAAIEAAVNPEPGNWLYFVTVNPETGETKFAESYEEHLRNEAEFNEWCQANSC